jgi:hypothetical protein
MKLGALLFAMFFLTAACGPGSTGGDTRDATYDEGASPRLDSQPGLDVISPPQDAISARNDGGRGVTGDPCTSDSECGTIGTNAHAVCMTTWPGGGACANECDGNPDVCPGRDSLSYNCVLFEGAYHCVFLCLFSYECPAGYTCVGTGCVPAN